MHKTSLKVMRSGLPFGVALVVLTGCEPISTIPKLDSPRLADGSAPVDRSGKEVLGRTECAPRRKGMIAPVPLHPGVEVLVSAGDRVNKGRPLVRLDDEAQAEVRAKRAELENARIDLKESRRYLGTIEKAISTFPEVAYHKARTAGLAAEMHERAAEAAWESAKAELQHYVVNCADRRRGELAGRQPRYGLAPRYRRVGRNPGSERNRRAL